MRKVLEHRALVACAERSYTFGVILIGTDEKIPGTSNSIVWVAHSAIQAAIKVEHQEIKNVCAVKLDRVSRTQLLSLSFESVPSCCVPSVNKVRRPYSTPYACIKAINIPEGHSRFDLDHNGSVS